MNYLTHLWALLMTISMVCLIGCNSKENKVIPDKPVITLKDTGNGNYKKGDKARFTITAGVPAGLKTLSYTKTVDGTESSPITLSVATEDATSIQAVPFEVEVTEEDGKTVTITVTVLDKSDQVAAGVITYTVNSLPDVPTVTLKDNGTGEYRKGSNASYTITASIPGGLKALSYTKTVDGTESNATAINVTNINTGDTQVNTTFSIPVTESAGKKVSVKVTVIDKNDRSSSAELIYTVASIPLPTLTLSDKGNGNYEKGDKIAYGIVAKIPGGLKILSSTKVVDGVESAANAITGVSPGDTTINGTVSIDVMEAAGKQVKIKFLLVDLSDQQVITEVNYTVQATGQGGGGTVPILSGKTTVSLGSENATLGGFLATSKGASGVFKSSQAKANQADIDITFGVGNTSGPSLISPDALAAAGLNAGNPVMNAPRTTFFKAEPNGPTDLSTVRAIEVESNISKSTSKQINLAVGRTYSFVQDGTTGKKGYIRVNSITGTGTNRTVTIEFIVQR